MSGQLSGQVIGALNVDLVMRVITGDFDKCQSDEVKTWSMFGKE